MKLGWLQDETDERDFSFSTHHGIAGVSGALPDLRRLRGERLEQGSASSCVAFSLTRALQISMARDAEESGSPLVEDIASPSFIYYNARQQEQAGRTQPTSANLVDKGCFPRLAMKSIQALGYAQWGDYPYDVARVNKRPPMFCYTNAQDQKGLRYYRIEGSGAMRIAELESALSQGYPVIFGMQVDKAFLKAGNAPVDAINPREVLGGHMMAVLAVDSSGVLIDNWWGPEWGCGDGMGRLTASLFGSSFVSDVYVISSAPRFQHG